MSRRFVLILVLALSSIACGRNGDPGVTSSPTPAPSLGPERTEPGVPGPLAARARSSDDMNQDVQSGQDIFITDGGFVPKALYAVVGAEVWITNETDEAKEVEFLNFDWNSGPIEPGDHAVFTPEEGLTFAYRLVGDDGVRGSIEATPYYEAGETAAPAS
jgi:hypothetical protein